MHAGKVGLFGDVVPVRTKVLLHLRGLGDHHHAGGFAVESVHPVQGGKSGAFGEEMRERVSNASVEELADIAAAERKGEYVQNTEV